MLKLPSFIAIFLAFTLPIPVSLGKATSPKDEKKEDHNASVPGEASQPTRKALPSPSSPPSPTKSEKKAICKTYSGKHISYYDRVYHVVGCQRYELNPRQTYELTRLNKPPVEVNARVIDSLPHAGYEKTKRIRNKTLCEQYHHKYVTYAFVDVYWVEGCVKRPFPDWASYEVHAGKLRRDRPSLNPIDPEDFHALKTGSPMKSIIDEEFRELLEDKTEKADILPLDEACRGLIGNHVTYLGHIFYISKVPGKKGGGSFCERRPVDSQQYTRKMGMKGFRLHELTSSQALSIPTGIPMPKKDEKSG